WRPRGCARASATTPLRSRRCTCAHPHPRSGGRRRAPGPRLTRAPERNVMFKTDLTPRTPGRLSLPEDLIIERMLTDDVPAVMAVDRLCFPTPWSENAYRSEMGNVSAHYLVARLPARAGRAGAAREGRLVGFAGGWIVMDEAHITTIGVHPDY